MGTTIWLILFLVCLLEMQILCIPSSHFIHVPIIYTPHCTTCFLQNIPPIHNPPNCQYAAPTVSEENLVHPSGIYEHEENHPKDHHHHNGHYKFSYSVKDHKSGDIKHHDEERNGDAVRGEYSLVEDDGNVRTVKYYADWKTGFHAQVYNSKHRNLR